MLSIIICSREPKFNFKLFENIKETVGREYEIIVIDNSKSKYSIAEAYNRGINQAKFPYLIFVHEDVLLHTSNWGKNLIDIFLKNPDVGLIGVAGSKTKTKMPSAWWELGENVWHIVQHFKYKPKEYWKQGFEKDSLVEVAVIDGVFMAMLNNEKIRFDERLPGFHNYDLSISLQHQKISRKVVVTSEILIEHFSEGNLNKSWYISTSKFHRFYRRFLPSYVGNFSHSSSVLRKKEIIFGNEFINKLLDESLFKEALYWWWQLFKLKPVSKYHSKILSRLLFK